MKVIGCGVQVGGGGGGSVLLDVLYIKTNVA